MPVTEKTETQQEKQSGQKDLQDRKDSIADDFVSTLDLSGFGEAEETETPEPETPEKKEIPKKKEPEEEEENKEEESEETEEEDDDEEVIPKSKFKKRLDAEMNRRRVLEAKVKELEDKNASKPTSRKAKLENMSETELKTLKRDAKAEWKRTEDPTKEAELDDLIDEIEEVARTGPQRFQNAQIKELNSTATEVQSKSDYEHIDFMKYGKDILDTAKKIYQKYPDLHTLKTGQATALEMAVEHYSEVLKSSSGKSKELQKKTEKTLEKRKLSLDSSAVKGAPDKEGRKKSYDSAKSGGLNEKADYFVDHVLGGVDKYIKS